MIMIFTDTDKAQAVVLSTGLVKPPPPYSPALHGRQYDQIHVNFKNYELNFKIDLIQCKLYELHFKIYLIKFVKSLIWGPLTGVI